MTDISTLPLLNLATLQPPMNITVVTPDSGLDKLAVFVAEKLAKREPMGLDTETNWVSDFFFRKIRINKEEERNHTKDKRKNSSL